MQMIKVSNKTIELILGINLSVREGNEDGTMIEIIDTEPTLWDKIRMIAEYYSKDSQSKKLLEEMVELAVEINFGLFENGGNLPDNTWSEVADVIIMCAQITMQHGKEDKVREWINYKVDRQLRRMENEKEDPEWKQNLMDRFTEVK